VLTFPVTLSNGQESRAAGVPFGVLTQDFLSCQRKSPQNRRNVSALSQAWRLYAQILSVSSGTAKV
jgi:hypothetical protein